MTRTQPNLPPAWDGTFSRRTYSVTGSQTSFDIPFPFKGSSNFSGSTTAQSDQIIVFRSGIQQTSGWYMPDASTIVFNSAVTGTVDNPTNIIIRRYTNFGEDYASYVDGNPLDRTSLETNDSQVTFFRLQELADDMYEWSQYVGADSFTNGYSFTSDGTTTTFTLYESEAKFENGLIEEDELIVQVGGQFLHPTDFVLDENSDGYNTVTISEAAPSGTKIYIRPFTSGNAQAIDVSVSIADGSITADKLANPLITIDTWNDLVSIDDGAKETAVDKDVLIWDADSGGSTTLNQRPLTSDDLSDFDDAVQDNPLSSMATPTNNIDLGGYKATNAGTPTADNDLANKAYVDDQVKSFGSSNVISGTVSFASPGSTTVELPNAPKWVKYIRTEAAITNQNDSEFLASQFPWAGGGSPRQLTVSSTGSNITFTTSGSGTATCNIEYVILAGE